MNQQISFLIAGSILLLSFLMLANPSGVNKKGNIFFGVFLLLWSTYWLDEGITSEHVKNNSIFIFIKSFTQFLVPLVFYISVKFFTNPSHSITDYRFFISPVIFLIFFLSKPLFSPSLYNWVFVTLMFAHAILYITLSYLVVQRHQKNIESFISNKEPVDLNWIKYIIYTFIGTTFILVIYSLFINASSLNVYINTFFLFVVFMVGYFSIKQGEIFPALSENKEEKDVFSETIEETTKINKLYSDDVLKIQTEKVIQFMENEKPYLDSELNLSKLAGMLSISSHQLSYIINNGIGESFFIFVNKYKVKKAQELLNNTAYDHYTILAIAFKSGFNSKTAFNTTFKKITSLTPTEYRKLRSD